MENSKAALIVALVLFGAGFGMFANGLQIFLTRYFRAPFSGKPVQGKVARLSGGLMVGAGILGVGYSGYLFWTKIILVL